ncbi:MAG TPA: hypothetical protein VM327_02975 [Candidatus Thermoplasmatota archaeon]|nr:hypothetical protein [Candidatus Thermoplasmatota archaeon]
MAPRQRPVTPPRKAHRPSLRERTAADRLAVLQFVRERPGAIYVEIQRAAGIKPWSDSKTTRILGLLEEDKQIEREEPGKFVHYFAKGSKPKHWQALCLLRDPELMTLYRAIWIVPGEGTPHYARFLGWHHKTGEYWMKKLEDAGLIKHTTRYTIQGFDPVLLPGFSRDEIGAIVS